jgi:hypothetical protein
MSNVIDHKLLDSAGEQVSNSAMINLISNVIERILSLPVPFNMVVIIVAIVFASGIITSVAKQVRKYACLRHELNFKRELLDRGMSVDEIEQVVKARSPSQLDESM